MYSYSFSLVVIKYQPWLKLASFVCSISSFSFRISLITAIVVSVKIKERTLSCDQQKLLVSLIKILLTTIQSLIMFNKYRGK